MGGVVENKQSRLRGTQPESRFPMMPLNHSAATPNLSDSAAQASQKLSGIYVIFPLIAILLPPFGVQKKIFKTC
jgi:hypothetical protein